MSLLLMALSVPSKGTPSKMISGELEALIEPIPLMRIAELLPGCPEEVEICTPATAPSKVLATSVVCLA